jgi:DMSO reductase anchor subunit
MLVLTQASVGGLLAELAARSAGVRVSWMLPGLSLALGLAGINASLLHLGRPLYAYRALIGLRHSWLSREIAAFGLFAALALAHGATVLFRPSLATVTSALSGAAGIAAVVCSVMVYHVVRRPFWHAAWSLPRFAGTALVLGLALATLEFRSSDMLVFGVALATSIKLLAELFILTHLRDPRRSPLRRTALLLRGPLLRVSMLRLALGLCGGVVLPVLQWTAMDGMPFETRVAVSGLVFLTLLAGELAERTLFFQAVTRPKMPGGLPS